MSEVKYAIPILKEKFANADRHNLAYQRLSVAEMEAIWGTLEKSDKDYAELKAQRDALAAENAALKERVDHAAGCIHAAEVEGLQDALESRDGERLSDLVHRRLCHAYLPAQSQATDAYLNSVRAEGVDMFISELAELFKTLKTGGKPWQAIKGVALMAASFSAKLRAGEPS